MADPGVLHGLGSLCTEPRDMSTTHKEDRLKRRALTPLFLLCLWLVPTGASAQVTPAAGYVPPDDTQSVRVGVLIFYDYTFTKLPKTTDAAGNVISSSAFNVVRTYINVTGNISHAISFRITPDISRETGAGASLAGSLELRLKYGYAQLALDDWTGSWKGTWVRLGQQQNPLVDYQESFYRYRFQGTVFVERDGFLPSADSGVAFHTNLPNNYGDAHVAFFNGEGYTKAEANDQKAFQMRGSLRPFAMGAPVMRGLRVTGFYDHDSYVKSAPRNRVSLSGSFEHKRLNAGFDYISAKDQTLPTASLVLSKGWSVWATPFLKEKGNGPEVLLRYDHFTPNTATPTQQRKRIIAGFAYWLPHPGGTGTACLLLDFEQVTSDNFPATPATAKQQRITLHGLISF